MRRLFTFSGAIGASIVDFSKVKEETKTENFQQRLKLAEKVVLRFKEERGVPGISIGVSKDGDIVWKKGFGYTDVENLTPCTYGAVMRIASISKPITMLIAAKVVEDGKLDLDAPVQKYVPEFPEKYVDGEKVVVTTRQLVSHLSGVRHYEKPSEVAKLKENQPTIDGKPVENVDKKKPEFNWSEYYNQKQYKSVKEAMEMFKNDPLLSKPGEKFHYTTHGWTLVSAVVEAAAGNGAKFENMLADTFQRLNMNHSYLDNNPNVIGCRSKFYRRNRQTGRLENVPCVNSSYKWAGGGLLSTVEDLLIFADAMVTSYKGSVATATHLKPETVAKLWTPVEKTECSWDRRRGRYAMGWCVVPAFEESKNSALLHEKVHCVSHTGGAVGASSILLIKPSYARGRRKNGKIENNEEPTVICVAVLTNLQECGGLNQLAHDIANIFDS